MPQVSVLMPVCSGERYLASAIRSILWQTFTDWELLIIDDGSADGSLACAQKFAAADRRLRVVSRPHRGLIDTLNEGLRLCSASLIARMDSDDISAPRRLEKQLKYIKEHPDITALGSFVRLFPRRSRSLGMKRYERWLNRCWQSRDLAADIFVESPLVHPSVLFKKEEILELGGYRSCPWPEDYDLWMRLWQNKRTLAKVPEVLCFWRDTPQRLTHTDERCGHASLRRLKIHYLLETFFPECRPCGTAPPHRPVLVWGAGSNGRDLVKDLRLLGLHPCAFADNHPSRRGQRILGLPVLSPNEVRLLNREFVIMAVSNPYTRTEVRGQLNALGAEEGRDYVCLANIAK